MNDTYQRHKYNEKNGGHVVMVYLIVLKQGIEVGQVGEVLHEKFGLTVVNEVGTNEPIGCN